MFGIEFLSMSPLSNRKNRFDLCCEMRQAAAPKGAAVWRFFIKGG